MPNITIKTGSLEVSYDGDQAFIEGGLLILLKELAAVVPQAAKSAPTSAEGSASSEGGALGHTTSQIAHALGANTGPELALAAAAHLTLVKGQDKVKRSEINAEMKGAGSFYKETYSKNLSGALSSLIKDKKLNPVGNEVYSLPNALRKEFAQKLLSE